MSHSEAINRHYQLGQEAVDLVTEFEEGNIRVLTSTYQARICDLMHAFAENTNVLPKKLPTELQQYIRKTLSPALYRLGLIQGVIGLFGLPGDNTKDDGPDFGGDDDDPKKKPSPTSPLPMAV